jgi:hypothetical protein
LALISVSETNNPVYLLYVNVSKPAPLCWNWLFCPGADNGAFLEGVWKLLYRKTVLIVHQRPKVAASMNNWGMQAAPVLWVRFL